MKVYYREGDEAFYGDLMYITAAADGPVLSFDTKSYGATRKRVSLKGLMIVSIGMSQIHVKHDGNDYLFYAEQPEWVQLTPKIADWLLRNENPSPQSDLLAATNAILRSEV